MSETKMIHDSDLRRYVWHAGPYIEVGPRPEEGEEFQPMDVLNVWDYEKAEPVIPRSFHAFERHCERADIEFECQFLAEDQCSQYSELADLLAEASAEGMDDLDEVQVKAQEMDHAGELDRDTLEYIERLHRRAREANAL